MRDTDTERKTAICVQLGPGREKENTDLPIRSKSNVYTCTYMCAMYNVRTYNGWRDGECSDIDPTQYRVVPSSDSAGAGVGVATSNVATR